MFGLTVQTPPAAGPVTAEKLRGRLRLNHTAEDELLDELLAAAVELFELDAGRPVLATTYRQHLAAWPFGYLVDSTVDPMARIPGAIVLGRGGVTSVTGLYRTLGDGSAEAVTGWAADLVTPPARVRLASAPPPATTSAGLLVSPVGYVEFVAGWANAAAVPALVTNALCLVAAHWYQHRAAYTERTLDELAGGWRRVVDKFRSGLSGPWGQ